MIASGTLIHVHRGAITSFSTSTITLSTGATLPSSATVFATGWRTNQPDIFDPSLLPHLGLPYNVSSQSPSDASHWNDLDTASESKIRSLFPLLADPPSHIKAYDAARQRTPTLTPFRLFRGIAPPSLAAKGSRDLVILGTLLNTAVPTYAEISSLWAVAYLESLPFCPATTTLLSSLSLMEKAVSLITAWGWVRYRDRTASYLDGSVEIQDFMDELVRDLGLRAERKRVRGEKGWRVFGARARAREWLEPYRGRDYRGLVGEYLRRWKLEGGKEEV